MVLRHAATPSLPLHTFHNICPGMHLTRAFPHRVACASKSGSPYRVATHACTRLVEPHEQQLYMFADITVFGAVRVPTRYLPALYIAYSCIWAYLQGPMFVLPPVLAGTYSAWFYLRFVQVNGSGALSTHL